MQKFDEILQQKAPGQFKIEIFRRRGWGPSVRCRSN
jgi:hypothetical protein